MLVVGGGGNGASPFLCPWKGESVLVALREAFSEEYNFSSCITGIYQIVDFTLPVSGSLASLEQCRTPWALP